MKKQLSPVQWQNTLLDSHSTMEMVIRNLDITGLKIVLVMNSEGKLEGTISDGDIRRALLRGLTLDSPIDSLINRMPMVVVPDMGRDLVLQLMVANKLQQIPIVDSERRVMGLHLWDEITTKAERPNTMIIMAGGFGTRLRPHTGNCPKPMLHVAGKPILEHIIDRAKSEGFAKFIISVHYLAHVIEDYFTNGSKFGVDIEYLRENSPLGTAGALGLIQDYPNHSFIVSNGDVITDIRYGELLDFHEHHNASATMAVRLHEWQHPFGVVQTAGVEITGFEEKPITRSQINAGVYALSADVLHELNPGEPCDMPTLFGRLQQRGKRTIAYPMYEPWLDIGRPEDLQSANNNPQ
jgi:dTDP-glucose pyrophosphorylase